MSNNKSKDSNTEELAEQIELQVEECLDKIDKAISDYHIAVRYLALKRIIMDETSIMCKDYKWVDHWMPNPPKDDHMIM